MDPFGYREGDLYCENVRAEDIVRRFGTPTVVYSAHALGLNTRRFAKAFGPLQPRIAFAVKALPNAGVLRVLADLGCGLVAVSGGELERAWLGAVPMSQVLFAGVGKTDDDIRAGLDGIYSPLFQRGQTVNGRPPYYRGPVGWFVAESLAELERIARQASALRVNCRAAVRVNTELEVPGDEQLMAAAADSKFGVPASAAREAFELFSDDPRMNLSGLHMHLGPSVHDLDRFVGAVERLLALADELLSAGRTIDMIDIGGGFPAMGLSETAPGPEDFAQRLIPLLKPFVKRDVRLTLEPGRAIAASAGVLLLGVREVKAAEDRHIVVCDGGLNPANRPLDVDGFRAAWPIAVSPDQQPPASGTERMDTAGMAWCDIAGPTGRNIDMIGRGRLIPPVEPHGAIAIFGAGAYALSACQTDSEHPPPAEVLVEGARPTLVRHRPSLIENLATELPALDKL